MTTDDPAARLAGIRDQIDKARRLARRSDPVELIAVSKTHGVDAILPLIAAGQRAFGENRVQEAQAKWPALKAAHPGIRLALIGQLQSNKAHDAVALFDQIHSVDRPSLVTALARAMDAAGRLFVAHASLGHVFVFAPNGELIARIKSCAGQSCTNVAIGGDKRDRLYITESASGTILLAALDDLR